MLMNIIFTICLYPVMPIIYYAMKSSIKSKKNLVLGVTLPSEYLENEEVLRLCDAYQKELRNIYRIMAVIPIPFYFIKYLSIATLLWMIWLFLLIYLSYYPYIKYNKQLTLLKATNEWRIQNRQEVLIDTMTANDNVHVINKRYFLPSVILSFIPFIYECTRMAFDNYHYMKLVVLFTNGFITAIFLFVGHCIDRQKSDVISMNSDFNANYNRARKHIWAKCLLILAWANTAFTFAVWCLYAGLISTIVFLFITTIYAVVISFLCFKSGINMRKVQSGILSKVEDSDRLLSDEDSHWIGGMIYYNPSEGSTLVEKRVGYGFTINMASKAGKFLMGLLILSLLSIPVVSLWFIFEELTPISLQVSGNQIVAEQLKKDYVVDLDHIKKVTLINDMPKSDRVMGTALSNLLKGTYYVKGYGKCEFFLNPKNKVFILVNTKDKTYLFSGKNDQETKGIYDVITK